MKILYPFLALALVTTLTACDGGWSDGSSNDDDDISAQLSVGITDGPVENASAIVISFNAIELHGAENTIIEFDPAKTINLLDYQGTDRLLLLDNKKLTAGDYQWLRLSIVESDSYIRLNGTQRHPLVIPSSAQTGLKLNRNFTLGAGNHTDFTIDFDLRKSIHQEGTGDYTLRPTLRLVDNLDVNTITGTIAEALITDPNCNNGSNNDTGNAVYLFAGHDALIQDIQTNTNDPITSASVNYNSNSTKYEFTIGFVPIGDYSIAFTCDALLDSSIDDNSVGNTQAKDEVNFSNAVNLNVNDDNVTSVTLD